MTRNTPLSASNDDILLAIHGLKDDLGEVKIDVASLKDDLGEVKTDVAGLKTDVASLKDDVVGLKEDLGGVKIDVSGLKDTVSGLKIEVGGLDYKLDSFEKYVRQEVKDVRYDFGQRLTNLEAMQRVTHTRLDSIEGEAIAIRGDIKELYSLIPKRI